MAGDRRNVHFSVGWHAIKIQEILPSLTRALGSGIMMQTGIISRMRRRLLWQHQIQTLNQEKVQNLR